MSDSSFSKGRVSNIKLFHNQQIRSQWNAHQEQWFFSVIDIIQALTGNERPRKYWGDLKKKLNQEGSQLSDKIGQLKMPSADGKSYLTDVANTETLLRLIQSIPKAEPFGKQVITSKTPSNWVEPKNLGLRNHD